MKMSIGQISIIFLILLTGFCSAQDYQYEDDPLAELLYDSNLVNKLFDIAWRNYPEGRIWESRLEIAELQKGNETWSWLNALSFNYIYYPDFLNAQTEPGTQSNFSRFGIGLSVSLGTVLSVPDRVGQATENIKIAERNIELQKLNIKFEVSRRYYYYIQQKRLLISRLKSLEDDRNGLSLAKYKYDRGELSLDFYNQALTQYNVSKERVYETESNLAVAKASIEELLGVKLETIEGAF